MIAASAIGAFLVFARLGGLLMTLPGLSGGAVPVFARLALAVPLTIVLLPAVAPSALPQSTAGLVLALVVEVGIGAAMGVGVSVLYGALAVAFEVASVKMGLNLGILLDPLTRAQQGALGSLAGWLAAGAFFGGDLHLACLEALGESYAALPAGAGGSLAAVGPVLVELVQAATVAAIQLVGPLVVFLFLVNLALLVLGRMASNLQVFFGVGTSVTVIVGFGVLAIALPAILGAWTGLAARSAAWIARVVEVVSGG